MIVDDAFGFSTTFARLTGITAIQVINNGAQMNNGVVAVTVPIFLPGCCFSRLQLRSDERFTQHGSRRSRAGIDAEASLPPRRRRIRIMWAKDHSATARPTIEISGLHIVSCRLRNPMYVAVRPPSATRYRLTEEEV